ncbi:MAG: RluA family pseudouridine synthase [Planctomycetes bacterium]|nr:RluA family pseudouridine synthase [Planctomycetota bacterium]
MRTIETTAAEAGQRLDRYLRKLLPDVPLGGIFKLLRRGAIKVDGKKAKQDLRLQAGMVLTIAVADAELAPPPPATPVPPTNALPPELRPRIVHRDCDLLVVDKPAGLAVQPGSGNEHSLCSWLDVQPFGVRTRTFRPAPAHRLDRGTSGLVAIGLSPQGARGLAAAFRDDLVHKQYLAVVEGRLRDERGTIDAPLAVRDTARPHQPKALVDPANGKPARTDYEVLEVGSGLALLRLVLHTGRMHQLRAHLAHMGHPIAGDRRYGAQRDLGRGIFLLHAEQLELPHPVTGEPLRFRVPAPASFRRALDGSRA